MYIRLFIAHDVFVVISLPKSFIYCLPIIFFIPRIYSTVFMDFSLGQSLVMDFRLGQSLVVALLQYYFGRRLGNRFYMGRRFWGSFLFWVDHEGRPYVIRYILVDGWGCHYGIRFNQCGNVNHSFSTICTVSFNIIIPFSICPNTHTLLWQQMVMKYNPP